MVKCPHCGGEMEYEITSEQVTCKYCGSQFNPNETIAEMKASKEVNDDYLQGHAYQCTQCGATLSTFDDTAVTFCSYCGSQAMIESKLKDETRPDKVIPFKVTKEECIEKYNKLVKDFFFAPSYLSEKNNIDKFRGIYMPYVVYSFRNKGTIHNTGQKYSHHSGDYDYYDKFDISADIDSSYEGMSYDLVSKFSDKFSGAVPHDFNESKDFNTNYLIGYYVDSKDVDEDTYIDDAIEVIQSDVEVKLKQNPQFAKYGCPSPTFKPALTDKKIGLFPVYFLGIKDQKNNMNYAVVNGQTGAIAADLPISFKKYVITTLIFALLIYLFISNFLVLNPQEINIVSIISAVICLIVSNSQIKTIRSQLFSLKDKGMKSKKQTITKQEEKEILKVTKGFRIKQVLGIIIGLLVFITNPVDDMYYYISALIVFVLIILSVYDLVQEHNIMSSSKPPQLEKRGGDISE